MTSMEERFRRASGEPGDYVPVDTRRVIWRVDFMRLVLGLYSLTLGAQDPSGNEVEMLRLVEPATNPRLVLQVAMVSPDGSKASIEIPWHNVAAIYWKIGG